MIIMHAASCYLEHLKISENPISSSGKSKPNIKNHSKTKGVIVYKHCTTSLVSFSLPSSWQRYHTKENIWRDLRSHSLLGRIESSSAKRFKLTCECLQLRLSRLSRHWMGGQHPSIPLQLRTTTPQWISNTSQDHSLTSRPSWQAHAFWAQFSMKIMIHDQLLYWPQTALIFWFWWMFLQSTLMIACESAIQWTCPFYLEDLVQSMLVYLCSSYWKKLKELRQSACNDFRPLWRRGPPDCLCRFYRRFTYWSQVSRAHLKSDIARMCIAIH